MPRPSTSQNDLRPETKRSSWVSEINEKTVRRLTKCMFIKWWCFHLQDCSADARTREAEVETQLKSEANCIEIARDTRDRLTLCQISDTLDPGRRLHPSRPRSDRPCGQIFGWRVAIANIAQRFSSTVILHFNPIRASMGPIASRLSQVD